jgi:hypothetical protein
LPHLDAWDLTVGIEIPTTTTITTTTPQINPTTRSLDALELGQYIRSLLLLLLLLLVDDR